MKSLFFTILTIFISALVVAQDARLGKVSHTFNGSQTAMSYFNRGLVQLYAMEYEAAAENFNMAQLLDPNFTMAAWGESMSYYRPLIAEINTQKGTASLYKLAVNEDQRAAKAQTEEEKMLLGVAERIFYGKGTPEQQDTALINHFEKIIKKFPDHMEIQLSYALYKLPEILQNGSSKEKIAFAQKVEKLLTKNPEHPGALFSLLLASDQNATAQVALSFADTYRKTAADSKVAHHVASKIYARLGQWPAFTESNARSFEISEKIRVANKGTVDDLFFKAYWWQMYGLLQMGKHEAAYELLRQMNTYAQYSRTSLTRHYLALMKSTYLAETDAWESPAGGIEIPLYELPEFTKCIIHFLDGRHELANNDVNKAKYHLMQLIEHKNMMQVAKSSPHLLYITPAGLKELRGPKENDLCEILELWLGGQIDEVEGNMSEALAKSKKAVELEAKYSSQSGPVMIPGYTRNWYARLLMKAGENAEAMAHLQNLLQDYPGNAQTLNQLITAAKLAGKSDVSENARKQLLQNWRTGDAALQRSIKP